MFIGKENLLQKFSQFGFKAKGNGHGKAKFGFGNKADSNGKGHGLKLGHHKNGKFDKSDNNPLASQYKKKSEDADWRGKVQNEPEPMDENLSAAMDEINDVKKKLANSELDYDGAAEQLQTTLDNLEASGDQAAVAGLLEEAIADLGDLDASTTAATADTSAINSALDSAETSLQALDSDFTAVTDDAIGDTTTGATGPIDVTEGSEDIVASSATADVDTSDVVALADGGHVVVYQNTDGSGSGVQMQQYDADGNSVGDAITVNSTTGGNQTRPAVTALEGGGFVVAYESDTGDGSGSAILAQRFDANAEAVGSEFVVNTTTSGAQSEVTLAGTSDGGFVSVYRSGNDFKAQRFDANGTATGGEIQIGSVGTESEQHAEVVTLDNGGFAVLIEEGNGDNGIHTNVFDASGNSVTGMTQIATGDGADEDSGASITALKDGGYVVAYANGSDLHMQSFDDNGTATTSDTVVASGIKLGGEVSVAALDDGTYVAAYSKGGDVMAQRFNSDNSVHTAEFQVSDGAVDDDGINVSATKDGFVVAYVSEETANQRVAQKKFTFTEEVASSTSVAGEAATTGNATLQSELSTRDSGGDVQTQAQTTYNRLSNMIADLERTQVTDTGQRDALVSDLTAIRDTLEPHVVDYGAVDQGQELAKITDKLDTATHVIGQSEQLSNVEITARPQPIDKVDVSHAAIKANKDLYGTFTELDTQGTDRVAQGRAEILAQLEAANVFQPAKRPTIGATNAASQKTGAMDLAARLEEMQQAEKDFLRERSRIKVTVPKMHVYDPSEFEAPEPIKIDLTQLMNNVMSKAQIGVSRSDKSADKVEAREKKAAEEVAEKAAQSSSAKERLQEAYGNPLHTEAKPRERVNAFDPRTVDRKPEPDLQTDPVLDPGAPSDPTAGLINPRDELQAQGKLEDALQLGEGLLHLLASGGGGMQQLATVAQEFVDEVTLAVENGVANFSSEESDALKAKLDTIKSGLGSLNLNQTTREILEATVDAAGLKLDAVDEKLAMQSTVVNTLTASIDGTAVGNHAVIGMGPGGVMNHLA